MLGCNRNSALQATPIGSKTIEGQITVGDTLAELKNFPDRSVPELCDLIGHFGTTAYRARLTSSPMTQIPILAPLAISLNTSSRKARLEHFIPCICGPCHFEIGAATAGAGTPR